MVTQNGTTQVEGEGEPAGRGAGEQTEQECFLCALDPHPCTVKKLEGRIIFAHEVNVNGEMTPFVTIDTGTYLASFSLTRHYRSLVKGLIDLGEAMRKNRLTLRVYHLPPVINITEHKGRKLHRYRANSYTLAILEPDTILNITDLNHAEYCPRQYLLHRLVSSAQSAATIRGNLVHHCFKELLKEHDRGKLMTGHLTSAPIRPANAAGAEGTRKGYPYHDTAQAGRKENEQETPLATLYRHFEERLENSSIELALANVSPEVIRADVAPHLESLATWFENQRTTLWDMPATSNDEQGEILRFAQDDTRAEAQKSENLVRAETFLLAPEIGLRGRLDLLWRQTGRQRLLELKTGGANAELPKSAHKWQVQGYHALLMVRRDSKMKKALATLLYSGTPGQAQDFGIPFTVKQLQRVNEVRNILVLSHVTGIPPAPPGPSRCTKCAMLEQCEQVSSLLKWQPPEFDKTSTHTSDAPVGADLSRPSPQRSAAERVSILRPSLDGNDDHRLNELRTFRGNHQSQDINDLSQDSEFFTRYYDLLQLEGREGELQQALLWKTSVAERLERGTAISDISAQGKPESTGQGEWEQTFLCKNTSELREGDEILLSDGNPITGEVVTGTIVSISAEQVKVWTPELIANPRLIDRYDTSIVHIRTLQNLLRWLKADFHMRGLVAGTIRPRFNSLQVFPRVDFNNEQNLAVERAMQMQDYLLVHGPPGTGKTSVIAEIVKRLCRQGQRVMLAAFTNQAVDNMLKRLDKEGFHDYVRLGQDRSVDEAIRNRLLKRLVEEKQHSLHTIREVLRNMPVVASTTATWSSEKYAPLSSAGMENNQEHSFLEFDVAIIDEAGQLTVPAILGALRFAKRFILVGDEKQLPPLVLSKEAAEKGLAESLFSLLKRLDNDYQRCHPERSEGSETLSACIPLRVQYRMNQAICDFASQIFYEGQLIAHGSVANRVLELATSTRWPMMEAPSIMRAISPTHPMVFLNVPGQGEQEGMKTSDAEARTVREVVTGLLARGIAPKDIGIIAPYRAQVANLRRHLLNEAERAYWQHFTSESLQGIDVTELSIDTVDRFQGGERSVIIMTFATTTTPPVESHLRDHLTNPNRLNVALTRAQRKLILVGCAPALEALPVFKRLLAYCQQMQTLTTHTSVNVPLRSQ